MDANTIKTLVLILAAGLLVISFFFSGDLGTGLFWTGAALWVVYGILLYLRK